MSSPLTTTPQTKRKTTARRNESHIWKFNYCRHDGVKIYCNIENCNKELGKKQYGTTNAESHLANVHQINIRDKEQ